MFIKLNSKYDNYPVINTDYVQYFTTGREYNINNNRYYYNIDILFTPLTELKSFCYGSDADGQNARDTDFERLTKLCLSTANAPIEKAKRNTKYDEEIDLI